jgi:ribosomal protein S18 acetylase RimI-like enzyme
VNAAFTIRRLQADDANSLVALRREALEGDPLAFVSSIDDDRGLSLDFVRASLADEHEQAVFGCFEGNHLVGMVGLLRGSKVKLRHTATVWGMYVAPRARKRGAGRALLAATLRHARGWRLVQVQLGVMDTAEAAKHLYESAGFRSWGREPRAIQWKGRFVDEHHLVLDLRASAAMTVRAAGIDDAIPIARVHIESWRAAYRGLMADDLLAGLDLAQRILLWRRILSASEWPTLVVEDEGAVVGFCYICPARDSDLDVRAWAELVAIYVDPTTWGRGCGRLLCERAIDEARNRGATSMAVWVLEANAPARRFYEGRGFVTDGTRKTDETLGLPEVRYVKELR